MAYWEFKERNEAFTKHTVVEMESEEHIFDELLHKDRLAVFLYLYTPGHFYTDSFNNVFE